ncbi:MAG: 3-phosphoshikimate 1-carboxyvinyltransferase [Saprospiraceae bacterium]|nr:3-phosphoshikimate 1-carboxyvinyltransferase [Saprospiraceae bacterium]MCB9324333.1 3-phosphoshikimate 1-carboxyvinyltransferase [Lewinellaceae bacterium]
MLSLRFPKKELTGKISLAGSKSISNRVLIIQALCEENFEIFKLANARDTDLLEKLLSSEEDLKDAGPAGTTFRFLTAYLSLKEGTQLLTGSDRMKQRPIKVLVEALRQLGANIEYVEKEGYPPLKIHAPEKIGTKNELAIPANTSSQYISALLMIAPVLPGGLSLTLDGEIVSLPYIQMTLKTMEYFGVTHSWEGNIIRIAPQKYKARPFKVEADWSAASYYYAMAVFAEKVDLELEGLFEHSVQGDAVLAEMMNGFGIQTTYTAQGIRLSRNAPPEDVFEWDFIECPDLAQTLAVVCAGAGIHGLFSGLKTLKIKETDRIKALQQELGKVKTWFNLLPPQITKDTKEYYLLEGRAEWDVPPVFSTYEDHRMAMAFAPLAMMGKILIEEPMVVVKSYPDFWNDLKKLGFEIEHLNH